MVRNIQFIACVALWALSASAFLPDDSHADILPPQQEAIRRFERIEVEATRESTTTDSEVSQSTTDSTRSRRERAGGFIGLELGPIFLGWSQQISNTDRETLISEDTSEVLQNDGLVSLLIPGIFTDESDGLILMVLNTTVEDDRIFTDTVSGVDVSRSIVASARRSGIFYQLFGIGIGLFLGQEEQRVSLGTTGQTAVKETFRFGFRERLFAINLGSGEGLFANFFVVNGETDRARGDLFDREPSSFDFQFTALGYRYDGGMQISFSASRFRSSSELKDLFFDETLEEKAALNLIIPPFSFGISQEDVRNNSEITQSGITEFTSSRFRLSRVSLGYLF